LQICSEKPIQIAMIGCGDRGKGVLSVIAKMPNYFTIVSYCDVLDFRLGRNKKVYSCSSAKPEKDYRKILDDKKIEAVFIATPLSEHFKIAKDADISR
jgi:predicted dehydrogenase